MRRDNERTESILDTLTQYQGRKVTVKQPQQGRVKVYEVVEVKQGRERVVRLVQHNLAFSNPQPCVLFGYEILREFQGAIIRIPGNFPLELDSPRGERIGAHD
jgi:nuclear transport factor 2 (NTF2) superfamily protein